jgi:Na+/H+ antiporter NhaD/arsenite permease-like protein
LIIRISSGLVIIITLNGVSTGRFPWPLMNRATIALVPHFSNLQLSWLTLTRATTLAGNFTLPGSVANLITAESTRNHTVTLSSIEYLKTGFMITLATLIIRVMWLIFLG